ncbi:MAG: pyridoxal phosphate-dependent aminotransferase [Pseudomonadota bacterium]
MKTPIKLSQYGQHYSSDSGIVELMDDLGSALRDNPQMLMMAGGTPARIPAAEQLFQTTLQQLAADPASTQALLGRYQGPKGDLAVRELLATQLREDYGWDLTADNIALTNGGQSAFSIVANMLAGEGSNGSKRIHFPLVPEYLGYADVGISKNFFSSARPQLQLLDDGLFKYTLDRSAVIPQDAAALCISRPTNPSGNVLTDDEVRFLDGAARARGIPLIVDAAYGLPFPALQYGDDTSAYWSDNVILLLSLSKVGMPGTRSGFLVAAADLIEAKALKAVALLREALRDIPCHIHKPEGAFFLWLWLPSLPVRSEQLYRQLKHHGLLVIPGENSFIGLAEPWDHSHQCIRLSYAVDDAMLAQAAAVLGSTLKKL